MRKCKISSQTILLLFSLVLIASLAIPAMAQDSLLINYQGRLTDDVGDPLDTTVMIMFNIYDVEEHFFWGEGQSTKVTDGLFNVILGSVVSLRIRSLVERTAILESQLVPIRRFHPAPC